MKMAEENKEVERTHKMSEHKLLFLETLKSELYALVNEIENVINKSSCNRSEASIIKAHGVILKSKLTQLHGAKIAD